MKVKILSSAHLMIKICKFSYMLIRKAHSFFPPDFIKEYISPSVELIRLILNSLHCGSSRQAEHLLSALSQTL